ncbi:MAG: 4'-phosphopantetheinyl transferase [Acidobacteria bacterium]|nr:MAG: 4'-phosphopantetheinyl transferase [Acidobacteriota bacterium]
MRNALLWKPPAAPPRLAAGEAHVVSVSLDDLPHPTPLWLSPDENRRASRFHFERDRRRFAAARGILRALLGRYLCVDPSDLVFGYGPHGKPALASPWHGLRFNVSHSGGLALLAFATDYEIGVDIEQERPLPEMDSIAERHFSPPENAELQLLAERERRRAFFRCWTRKEAFIKAVGDGLSHALDAFDVTLAPSEPARILRVEGDPEAAGRFRLEGLEPAHGFAAALAALGRPTRVVCFGLDQSLEGTNGPRREGRQNDLQGGREPRGAVLDLADGARQRARLEGRGEDRCEGGVPRLDQGRVDRYASPQPA